MMLRFLLFILFYSFSIISLALPQKFVYLKDIAPDIIQDMRYATPNNFMGRPVAGYMKKRCILTYKAAKKLADVQKAAQLKGYSLKVYDCYRPQKAVNDFYQWSQNSADTAMKARFYPREHKKELFNQGYIALSSGHTRGSTVDLTLIKLHAKANNPKPLTNCYGKSSKYIDDGSINTGTRFDCLDKSANVFYFNLTPEQKRNRLLLRNLMISNGFVPYEKEWWHFTLKAEPFPQTYFNFNVR